ncbi:MAG: PQQ-like beta-propeller repeat protein [Planctomycetes bacterium]|nr:PQQ-like beta-propeller repeat protein [Planctomycetota bacterium]
MKARVVLAAVVVMVTAGSSVAADWPQYLGPARNSTSPEKGLLRSWPQKGPEVLWTTAVGIGYGGPVVKDGKVYLLDRDDKVGDNLRCLDLSAGKDLWNFAYDAPGRVMFPGSRSVPIVDGNHVYSCGPYGDLYCIDINTHKPVWNKNIWKDFGGRRIPIWAITQCPLIYGDLLILASQAPDAGVVAYDKLTGNIAWKYDKFNKGSMILVDGLILATDGRQTLYLIEPDPSGFKALASAEVLGEGGTGSENDPLASRVGGSTQNWAPLALSSGKLLIRDQSRLKCVTIAP